MNIYAGTSGYAYKEWKGSFYPKDLPDKKMLHFYGERFQSVELNNTFYRMPTIPALKAWADQVPPSFRFAIKAPRQITHIKGLVDVASPVAHLLEVVRALDTSLGALLFQLPPGLKSDPSRLAGFLSLLPADCPVAMEFRHPSWFQDENLDLLHRSGVALCIADVEGDLQVPLAATARWGYLRLRKPDYSDLELHRWAEHIQQQDWQKAFVFFKHEAEGKGPQLARRFLAIAGNASDRF